MMMVEEPMDERITLRRRLHRPRRSSVAALQPLRFASDTADLEVGTVHVFDDDGGNVALVFMTAVGTVTVRMSSRFADDLASGVTRLVRQQRVQAAT
jgi:hypothetical protein